MLARPFRRKRHPLAHQASAPPGHGAAASRRGRTTGVAVRDGPETGHLLGLWQHLAQHLHQGVAKLAQSGGRIRVYLPGPSDTVAIQRLADRFAKTPTELLGLIDEARRAYQSLPVADGGSIEVFFRPGDPVFSCYRFDGTAVLTLYTHQRRRTGVPTFVCRDGGSLYQFVRDEFDALKQQSRPAPTGPAPEPPSGSSDPAPTPTPTPAGGPP